MSLSSGTTAPLRCLSAEHGDVRGRSQAHGGPAAGVRGQHRQAIQEEAPLAERVKSLAGRAAVDPCKLGDLQQARADLRAMQLRHLAQRAPTPAARQALADKECTSPPSGLVQGHVPPPHPVEGGGPMHGLDGVELQLDDDALLEHAPLPPPEALKPGHHVPVTDPLDFAAAVRAGARLVRSRGDGPLSDYDPKTLLLAYPCTFPNGTGGKPLKDMSAPAYHNLLLTRFPRQQHAANPHLLLHCFNVQQRMAVSAQARVQCRMRRGGDWDAVAALSMETVCAVTTLLAHNARNRDVQQALASAPEAVRRLYNEVRTCSSRVEGSPGSFASLRSRSTSSWYAHGMWTLMLNMNPSELDEPVVFEIAGHPYTFSTDGAPEQRPDSAERWRILAADPLAEAQFFDIFIQAFADVYLHWPVGATQQEKRDLPCIFGAIAAWFLKYESATRQSIHTHGAISQVSVL